ncbi:putative ataxin-3 homolog [Phalaenopsis equestris]|uniref:putative ataxin-3 homolog n=1 Tax=Phalaenopsis equestris TaxID=78828 RepID=UPI0009E39928|nr:putative ataxin-3 homolog [Phalaenopsis equestris]
MEGPSNGGLLYHEVQEAKLCAVHCVNTVLQGPFFSEVDLAALASDLDQKERLMMSEVSGVCSGDFLSEGSYNVSMGGDFSIQVLQKALEVWDLQAIPFDSPVAEVSKYEPELENAFICHLQNHWFCIRKVNGEWYNFNSLYPAPEHLSKFYLSAYLDSLMGSGWSIFLVRGMFPKECPIPVSDSTNGFGQWLTPDDAKRITMSCNQLQVPASGVASTPTNQSDAAADSIEQQEEQDLRAAIAASLMDVGVGNSGGDDDMRSPVALKIGMASSASGLDEEGGEVCIDGGVDETEELENRNLLSSTLQGKENVN